MEVEIIMEERQELMVSPTGTDETPILRTAHFLLPSVNSMEELPSPPLSYKPTFSELQKNSFRVKLKGHLNQMENWKAWVDRLQPTYQHIWKKTGIFDAIMASTYKILSDMDLLVGLAERWSAETNTFIFPWGEATLTLEDMMVLGGYSLLGDSIINPLETRELTDIYKKIDNECKRIKTSGYVNSHQWMNYFMGEGVGSQIEHEAFLVLWLSRFVLPNRNFSIASNLFPIAIHLSRGIPVALAPAVLASIYRELALLKKSVISFNKLRFNESDNDEFLAPLWVRIQLVQLWAWERFQTLRPIPNPIKCGEPRVARWQGLKRMGTENLRAAIDSTGEWFEWRPYATLVQNWVFSKLYRENTEWVVVEPSMDREFVSLAMCLRASELVGIECIKQYLPHRVAMQFGLDQDIPVRIPRFNQTPEIAWNNYTRPVKDTKLYVQSRFFCADVTYRYLEWRRQPMILPLDAIKNVVKKPPSKKRLRSLHFPLGGRKDGHDSLPPGFPPKSVGLQAVNYIKEEEGADTDILIFQDKRINENGLAGEGQHLLGTQFQSSLSPVAGKGTPIKIEPPMKCQGTSVLMEAPMEKAKEGMEDANITKAYGLSRSSTNDGKKNNSKRVVVIPVLELEDRITKLEGTIERIRAATNLGSKLPKQVPDEM